MAELILGTPSPKQYEALRTLTTKYCMYGGARGGGKSWYVRFLAVLMCLQYAGIKVLIVRLSYKELTNNHIEPLLVQLNGIAKYNKSDKVFRFPNGSTIWFGYCANDSDVSQYQGAEYDIIFIDEATNLRQEWIEKINICCRGTNNFVKRVIYTCNPGGISHNYFRRLFVDREYRDNENPDDYSFVQALVTDNETLMKTMPEYIQQLENLPPHLRAMWLEGSWDVVSGSFFDDFKTYPDLKIATELGIDPDVLRSQHRYCHVIPPFTPERWWTCVRSYDFGYQRPASLAWSFIDGDGIIYRAIECYFATDQPNEGLRWTPEEQARKAREIEETHPWLKGRKITGVADPAIWNSSYGDSIADTFSKYGIYFTPGDHERIPGWMQCHYRLQFDDKGYSRFYVFDNCKAFIRTIPLMMCSSTHPEDLDTSLEDHVADEWRYLCMSRPITPVQPTQQEIVICDPLNQFVKRRR